jgi:hypothetical protein
MPLDDVCYWHKADINFAAGHIGSLGKADSTKRTNR